MDILQLIKSRRTIRKFKQQKLDQALLMSLTDCGRLAPSARNQQPLEYFVVDEEALLEPIFKTLHWAGYIAPEGNPQEGEKPVSYIVVLVKKELETPFIKYDAGAAIQNMLLAAWSYGIGSCWLAAVDRKELSELLDIPDEYAIDSVIALGYPAEHPVVEDIEDSIRYYKDENKVLHVPKRKLDDVIHINKWR